MTPAQAALSQWCNENPFLIFLLLVLIIFVSGSVLNDFFRIFRRRRVIVKVTGQPEPESTDAEQTDT